jgi:hypothetical protein
MRHALTAAALWLVLLACGSARARRPTRPSRPGTGWCRPTAPAAAPRPGASKSVRVGGTVVAPTAGRRPACGSGRCAGGTRPTATTAADGRFAVDLEAEAVDPLLVWARTRTARCRRSSTERGTSVPARTSADVGLALRPARTFPVTVRRRRRPAGRGGLGGGPTPGSRTRREAHDRRGRGGRRSTPRPTRRSATCWRPSRGPGWTTCCSGGRTSLGPTRTGCRRTTPARSRSC